MTNHDWESMATSVMFGGHLPLGRYNLMMRPGKTSEHVAKAVKKAFATPPFKTEFHIIACARLLQKLVQPMPAKTVTVSIPQGKEVEFRAFAKTIGAEVV